MGICRPSRINQKHNKGWYPLQDPVRVCYLHIVSRNHFNTLLKPFQPAENINLSKVKSYRKGCLFLYYDFDSLDRFLSAT